jgi:hypothetical protein
MIKLSKIRKFEIGDRVRVISDCKTQGKVGIVTNYNESEYSRIRWVTVQLDGCENKHIYNEMSLIKEDESEVHNIVALTGNFKIARVQFLYGYNKDKIYNFALFDNDIVEGDFVLCDTQNGYHVAKVVGIEDVESSGVAVTKEIVCKVDFSKFERRKEVRKQKVELKTKLDKAIRENQDLILYETVAKSNAQVAELLAQYKALLGES